MQTRSALYQELLASDAPKEAIAVIGTGLGYNENYNQDRIISAVTKSSMMDKALTIGNCISKELNLTVYDPGTIPRMAKIVMKYRLNDGTRSSEWIQKGTFYVDTREEDTFKVLTVHAYDPMLFADKPYTQIKGSWPKLTYKTGSNDSERGVVNIIASRIGVEIDPRTAELLSANPISVPYPGEGVYTMREMLGYIGAMYGGNWIITDENKLRLIVLGDIPDEETNLLITEYAEYILIGGNRIIVR